MNRQSTSELIRSLRKSKGLSQEALADLAGINLRTLQRIEAGIAIPRGETLRLLARALEVPVETLSPPDESVTEHTFEDQGILKLLNLLALSFWFVPLGNILFPFALWMYKRNSVAGVRELGIRVLNFQITWTLAVYGLTFFGMMSAILGLMSNPVIIFCAIVALAIINTIVIISTNAKIVRGEEPVYDFSLKIIS